MSVSSVCVIPRKGQRARRSITSIQQTQRQLPTLPKLALYKANYEEDPVQGKQWRISSSSMGVMTINIYSPVKFIVLMSTIPRGSSVFEGARTALLRCGVSSFLGPGGESSLFSVQSC